MFSQNAQERLARTPGDIDVVRESGLHCARRADVRQRMRRVLVGVFLLPVEREHSIRVQFETTDDASNQLGVVLWDHTDRIAGLVGDAARSEVELDVMVSRPELPLAFLLS